MAKQFDSDDFLARWAVERLSEEEKVAFKGSKDEVPYKIILQGTDLLEVPPYDTDSAFQSVKEAVNKKVQRVVPLYKWASVAAILVISLGLWFVFKGQQQIYSTQFDEQLTIRLPDGSSAILNASSKLSYESKRWDKERTLNLSGEAFFMVDKGSQFTVTTEKGMVTVLGTQFTVKDSDAIFEVNCYEGKVSVTYKDISDSLISGESIRLLSEKLHRSKISQSKPNWLQERTFFKNAPLSEVLLKLSRQYRVKLQTDRIDLEQRFTGSFSNTNLETALKTICESMKISYFIANDGTIVFDKL